MGMENPEQPEEDICCRLIRAKYLKRKTLQQCSGRNDSQFWKGINIVKKIFKWGGSIVKNGKDTSFWEDVWIGEAPLRLIFPELYEHCRDKNCTVNYCWKGGEWKMESRRSFSPEELSQWENLLEMIRNVRISGEPDRVQWVLEKGGNSQPETTAWGEFGTASYPWRLKSSCGWFPKTDFRRLLTWKGKSGEEATNVSYTEN